MKQNGIKKRNKTLTISVMSKSESELAVQTFDSLNQAWPILTTVRKKNTDMSIPITFRLLLNIEIPFAYNTLKYLSNVIITWTQEGD